MREWFYSVGDEKIGPVASARMKEMSEAGEFESDALAWTEGMPDWVPVGSCHFDEDYATCEISGVVRPVSEMLEYGDKYILPEYKDQFVQALQEGGARADLDLFWSDYEYVDPGSRATLAKGSAIFGIVASIVAMVIFFASILTMDPEISGKEFGDLGVAMMIFAGALFFLSTILPTVFYCMWVHRVSKNAHIIHRGPLDQSPGWAVGFHFIPIASLWKPLMAISQIYNVSGGRPLAVMDNLVIWWWICLLVYTIGSNILGFLAFPAGIGCFVLWWIIVSRITLWQQQKAGLA